jgi:hypothetical protein
MVMMTGHRDSAFMGHAVCGHHVIANGRRAIAKKGLQVRILSGSCFHSHLAEILVVILHHESDVLPVKIVAR